MYLHYTFPERREIAWTFFLKMAMSRSSHDNLGFSTELHGVLRRLLALSWRLQYVHRVVTARALRVTGIPIALTTFCLHSEVVEITGRVLLSQFRHDPMLPVREHASAACLCPAILEPKGYYALVSSVFVSE